MSTEVGHGRSLKQLSTAAWVTAIVALAVGTFVVWVGFVGVLDARERVFDRLQPAEVAAQRLRTSVVDQETGLRGFALTRDDRLLQPYTAGRAAQAQAEAEIRALTVDDAAGPAVAAELSRVQGAMDDWRDTVADPVLDGPQDLQDLDGVVLRSTAVFDDVRGQLDRLDASIEGAQDDARGDLDATTLQLVWSIAAAVGLFGAVALWGSWVLRHRVVGPIDELVRAADAVATDRLDEPIEVRGAEEIERLALRVSEMRDRIVEELAAVELAREELARRAEELSRSNADLEQFAYVASHDLQEPLRKVASFCQLIEQRYGDQLDERGKTYIEFAVDGAKRMQALIADLLEFSRTGRSTQAFVPCDLGTIASEVVTGFADRLDGGRVDIGPLPTVSGDPTLYRALLQNLIGNAIKYRTEDEPPVVSLSAAATGSDVWTITCADNGIGIEPQYRDRVFAVFQRLHGRNEFEGTGIGLALCKRIVEFSGGRIWIDEPDGGGGTTVRFTLRSDPPARTADDPLPLTASAPPAPLAAPGASDPSPAPGTTTPLPHPTSGPR